MSTVEGLRPQGVNIGKEPEENPEEETVEIRYISVHIEPETGDPGLCPLCGGQMDHVFLDYELVVPNGEDEPVEVTPLKNSTTKLDLSLQGRL